MLNDLRFAFRAFAHRPGWTAVAVLTLAVGIGSATIVFDLCNLFLWQRLPVPASDELVYVYRESANGLFGPYGASSYPDYEDYRERATSYTDLAAAFTWRQVSLDTGDTTEMVNGWAVSGNYFSVLRVPPGLGRLLGRDDDRTGAARAVVISESLWQRLFGADPEVLGAEVRINGQSFTVAGVTPEWLTSTVSTDPAELWFPIAHAPDVLGPDVGWLTDRALDRLQILGRLQPGTELAQAQAELETIGVALDREQPLDDRKRRLTVAPATLSFAGDRESARPTLKLLSVAVALLLLLAAANVANLLLARASERRAEMAMRLALGAPRRRLVRQMLTESFALALVGCGVGLLAAAWARDLLRSFLTEDMVAVMRFDHRVLGLSLAVSVGVSLLFGIAPALHASRAALAATARGTRVRRWSTGELLVVAQVALAVVLLVVSAVLATSLAKLSKTDLGFSTDGILFARFSLNQARYSRERGQEFFRQVRERLEARAEMESAAIGIFMPPVFLDFNVSLTLPETPETPRKSRFNYVDGNYFRTLGIPLLAGRVFDASDAASERGVVVVSRTLAETLWPGESAIGRQIVVDRRSPGDPEPMHEVVGVVGDVLQHDLRSDGEPIIYFETTQRYRASHSLILRTTGDPDDTAQILREELREIDPALAVTLAKTTEQHHQDSLFKERLHAQAVGVFGGAGLVLALVGVVGVLSYTISRRLREIGIRMAVGAGHGDIRRLVLVRGLRMAVAGIGLGLVGAFWGTRLLAGSLPGLEPGGPALYATIAVLLGAVTLAASWWPARRAAKLDPLVVLRHE